MYIMVDSNTFVQKKIYNYVLKNEYICIPKSIDWILIFMKIVVSIPHVIPHIFNYVKSLIIIISQMGVFKVLTISKWKIWQTIILKLWKVKTIVN
jgi:hypothetical protein